MPDYLELYVTATSLVRLDFLLRDPDAPVRAAVIHNDALYVRPGLSEYRIQALTDVFLYIVCGQDDFSISVPLKWDELNFYETLLILV